MHSCTVIWRTYNQTCAVPLYPHPSSPCYLVLNWEDRCPSVHGWGLLVCFLGENVAREVWRGWHHPSHEIGNMHVVGHVWRSACAPQSFPPVVRMLRNVLCELSCASTRAFEMPCSCPAGAF